MEIDLMPCPTCRQPTLVEVPPCPDEHGVECPERACTVCGTALTVVGIALGADSIVRASPGMRRGRTAA